MIEDKINSFTKRLSKDFTIIQNNLIRTPELSCKAFKLLSIGLSHDGSWKFYKKQISTCFKEGDYTVDEAVKELRALGYLHLVAQKGVDGKMQGHRWFWFETKVSDEDFKIMFGQGGFPEVGDFGRSENIPPLRRPTSKKTNLKKENNNNPSVVEPSACVVFPSLNKLKIPNDIKIRLSNEHDEQKINKLVERVLKWKDRSGDGVACNTILNSWDTWSDEATLKDREEQNEVKMDDLIDKARKRKERALKIKCKYPESNFSVMGDHITQKFVKNNRTSMSIIYFIQDESDKLLDFIEEIHIKKNACH